MADDAAERAEYEQYLAYLDSLDREDTPSPTASTPPPQDNSFSYRLRNNLAAAANAAMPFADEGAAALRSVLPGYQGYDAELAAIRGQEKQYSAEHPYQSLLSSLLGVGATIPAIPSAVATKATPTLRALQAALEGGAYGAVAGFGSGEGGVGQRAIKAGEDAGMGALFGAAGSGVSDAMSRTAGTLDDAGLALQRKSLGARSGDYQKTVNSIQRIELPEGSESLTKSALNDLIESGAISNTREPSKLMAEIRASSDDLIDQRRSLIDAYESSGGPPVYPTFVKAKKFLADAKVPANELKQYKDTLTEIEQAIRNEGKGSLTFLDSQKQAFGDKWNPSDKVGSKFYRAIYNDIKTAIEGAVPPIKNVNKDLQKRIILESIIERSLAGKESSDAATQLLQMIRTSGGVGVPILAGIQSGHPLLGALVAGGVRAAQTPQGKNMAGIALKNSGSVLDALSSDGGSAISKLLIAALQNSQQGGQQ